ncbi:helix-turn-helix domain-containing protein [Sphingopyxis sp.]|uniref:helix-turn-helix domain-containing protein n=1 Tax=Sphingopyxis sp. TaxID=1908224 RepID=UPI0026198F92|nr:helix-turn-helix domain-containing protein [Sphingopyxis sp.]MCW0199893.1 helix-turn-helix domain-containing protein [Sphingopyxis sp.]
MSADAKRMGPSGRPYLNTAQAAHYLGIGARKLQRLRASGEGPRFRRHGRLIYYHPGDLESWSRGTAEPGGRHG